MIPYFEQPSLDLGVITIHAFGASVALALLLGTFLFQRRLLCEGLDRDTGESFVFWVVGFGFVGAHLVDRLLYHPAETLAEPWTLLMLWEGLSSMGGLFGGALGALLFLRRRRLSAQKAWRYLDAVAYVLPVGWLLGRIGCFFAFDHVGTPTDFFLGQEYVDGVVRHNLGLEEALYWAPIAVIMTLVGRRRRPPGFSIGLVAMLYAPGRFLLDFLRVSDERHAGLLVSQYAAVLLFAFGAYALTRSLRTGRDRTAARPPAGENAQAGAAS